jgi:hypothetical protein
MDDMNASLISLLRANMGMPIDPDLAADILVLADQIPSLVPFDVIDRIKPAVCGEFAFAVERIEDIEEEIKPLHKSHWIEIGRDPLTLRPNYEAFIKNERAGRFVMFTVRANDRLVGHCSLYLTESAHTGALIATEDALFFLEEARKGRTAQRFISYCEKALYQIGVREIEVSVKTVNRAARFFQMLGYKKMDIGLRKVMEGQNA